jgi:hypothetical protein
VCETNGRQFNAVEHRPQPRHRDILDEARDLVHGDRRRDYAAPRENFERIGIIWGVQLKLPEPIPPRTVALMMIGLKLAREIATAKRDNIRDAAGYALCADLCDEV